MTTAACATAAPHHLTGGGAAGARRQRVRVPWRLVASTHFSDAALAVYMKIAALAARAEGCTAAVPVLAGYLGMSRAAVERALTQLINPDPEGVVYVPTRRRTHRGGTGNTAHRTVRPAHPGERFVWLPVTAAEALSPRQLRAYAVLAYAHARRLPITAAELAALLRHQSGPQAGEPVHERTARRLVTSLATARWITVGRRAGHQGRHLVDVHDHPVQAATPAAPTDTDEGSGPDTDAGSLASKEDRGIDRRGDEGAGGPFRRRRDTGSRPAPPVENPAPPAAPAAPGLPRRAPGQTRPYTGPQLLISPRVHAVLEPVGHLLPGIRPWVLRQAAREIGRQLNRYATVDRLQQRIQTRYATLMADDLPDPGRWLLGAALPRWGCPTDPDCESGTRWHTGTRCEQCTARRHPPPTRLERTA